MNDPCLEIERIKILKSRYFRFLDSKAWSELKSLFAKDAVVGFPELQQEFSGEAFVDFAAQLMETVVSVHIGHMPEITLNADGTADGIWGMTDDLDAPNGMPQSKGAPVRMRGAGHYYEHYVKDGGQWKIQRMTLKRLRLDIT